MQNWTSIKTLPPAEERHVDYYVTILTPEGSRYVTDATYCYKKYNHPSQNWRFFREDGEYDIHDYGTIIAWMRVPETPAPFQG